MVNYLVQAKIVNHVLWINPYPTRLPKLSDFSMKFSSEGDVGQSLPSVEVVHVRALPIEPLPFFNVLNDVFFQKIKAHINNYAEIEDCIIGVGRPSRLALSCIAENKVAFSFVDVMDDFSAFYRGVSAYSMKCREQELAAQVDHIIYSAPTLLNKFNRIDQPKTLISNAYPMNRISKINCHDRDLNVIGFVGTIADWFDWELVLEIARALPSKLIQIIGPIRCIVPENMPVNIKLLPECSVDQAIEYTSQFGIGIIPFKINRLTDSVDPIKFYEMRALGIPVWSTSFGTMTYRIQEGQAILIENGTDWNLLYESSISNFLSGNELNQFRVENDWSDRFTKLSEIFEI